MRFATVSRGSRLVSHVSRFMCRVLSVCPSLTRGGVVSARRIKVWFCAVALNLFASARVCFRLCGCCGCDRWHQPILDALVRLPPLSPGDAVFYHTGERFGRRKASKERGMFATCRVLIHVASTGVYV